MTQHRVTAWPGTPVPVPRFERYRIELVELESGTWFVLGEEPPTLHDLPVDFYLREPEEVPRFRDLSRLATPLAQGGDFELGDLLQFVREWGIFMDRRDRDINVFDSEVIGIDDEQLVYLEVGDHESLDHARQAAVVELGFTTPHSEAPTVRGPEFDTWLANGRAGFRRVIHPLEVAMRLDRSQRFARAAKGYLAGDEKGLGVVADDINHALNPIGVRLLVGPEERASAFTLSALQLVNDVADRASALICKNERCGRVFTKQRGRARPEYGEYRTKGVLYCSKSCARAQGQRDYRRRTAAEKVAQNG